MDNNINPDETVKQRIDKLDKKLSKLIAVLTKEVKQAGIKTERKIARRKGGS